ncbi:serum paraoxonase/arylesterase 2-like [Ahaetulla prasina]|uniref:serum paraoxonase/arylesterase 2-like n=1 Tax=Ahaetulla prasina TaxID=499056 RepID=UPI0026492E14|nr:serum paraoxonase/arylesterase 2-like [Ahaetulla prasina]
MFLSSRGYRNQACAMAKLMLLLVVFIVFTAVFVERILVFRQKLFADRHLPPKRLPNCELIPGIDNGAEDIEILPNGLAFISSGLKYPGLKVFEPHKGGQILLMNLKSESPRPVELKIEGGFDLDSFNPHGISIYMENSDSIYLFVVNHPEGNSAVEIFKFFQDEKYLLYLRTVTNQLLSSVNDILAVGPEHFYATNDRYFRSETVSIYLEVFWGFSWTNVVYYSPKKVKEVASGFYSANGINMSPDGKFIYVADILDHSIQVFQKMSNMNLTPVKALKFETILDNISVDRKTGDLWLGCHPNAAKLISYDPKDPPGSEILLVKDILSDKPKIITVYVDDGTIIQGSSVAVYFERHLIVGTVFQKALYCHMP